MDVRCDRCQTEYELDDDIVTEAGASVQCTTCGHTFFVRPGGITGVIPKGVGDFSAPEAPGWTLRTEDGKVHRFRDFTTLQRWIVERKVTRHDRVSRASGPWQALGDIGDLAPFFAVVEEADRARIATSVSVSPSPGATAGPVSSGHAPPADVSQRMPGVTAPSLSGLTAAGTSEASRDRRIAEDGPTVPNRRLPSADAPGSVVPGASQRAAAAPAANDGRIGAGAGPAPITAPGSPPLRDRRPPQDLPPPPAVPLETTELLPARSRSRGLAWAVAGVLIAAGGYWWWSQRGGGAASSAGRGEVAPAASSGTERAAGPAAIPIPAPAPASPPASAPASPTTSSAMVASDSAPTAAPRPPVARPTTAVEARPPADSAPATAISAPANIAAKRGDSAKSAAAAALPGAPAGSYDRLVADADRALERGGPARADKLYAQALVLRPDGVAALTGSAYVLLDRQRHFQAIATFRRALAIDPTYGPALFGIAESYRARGDASQALVAYRQYLALSPAGADAPAARRQIKDLSSDDEPSTPPP